MTTLIIVESPHKAKAVAALARPALPGVVVAWACLGHLRDLPAERLAVDTAGDFTPEYAIPQNREKTVAALRQKIAQADTVLLATDPDREGEAVAWHITQAFANEIRGKSVQRIAFHAITAAAVQAAVKHPLSLDTGLVWAAVARRVLDRLLGYSLSPWLWKRFPNQKGLSAGRVQTAALRLLIEHSPAETSDEWEVEVDL